MRTFNIQLGPRDPNDEDRLVKQVFRSAQHGDTVNLSIDQSPRTSQHTTVPNERLETRVGDSVEARLEKKASDAQQVPPPADDAELVKRRAALTTRALLRVKERFTPVLYRVILEAIAKDVWKHIVENADAVYVVVKETIKEQINNQ